MVLLLDEKLFKTNVPGTTMTILKVKRFLKRKEKSTRNKPIQRTSQTRTIRQSRSLSSSSWQERFQELIQFREHRNHLFLPHRESHIKVTYLLVFMQQ